MYSSSSSLTAIGGKVSVFSAADLGLDPGRVAQIRITEQPDVGHLAPDDKGGLAVSANRFGLAFVLT